MENQEILYHLYTKFIKKLDEIFPNFIVNEINLNVPNLNPAKYLQ